MIYLLGKKLGHSISPIIHKKLGGYDYKLKEVAEDNLDSFFNARDFDGLNVTIPYKKTIVKFLDELDETAKAIGNVNTVINRDGKLIGYNTDYYGFSKMLAKNSVDVSNKSIVVLGDGGVSETVQYYLKNHNAKSIEVFSHKDIDNGVECTADIIINCTPVGMYPNADISPVDFEKIYGVSVAIEMTYKPYLTRFLAVARDKNIQIINGLYMLVAQAKMAGELFTGRCIDDQMIDKVFEDTKRDILNIVLVGMGGAGKSTIGKAVARLLNREFFDTDKLIENRVNTSTSSYILEYGENMFRDIEKEVVNELESKRGVIIATGGGTIIDDENMRSLSKNGILFFIDAPIERSDFASRPLYKTLDEAQDVYNNRLERYMCANFIIKNDYTRRIDDIAKEIINEAFSY